MATNGSYSQSGTEQYTATTTGATDSNNASASNGDLSKDEVGWYFVEQYYTNLSKAPEKLHLFYGKRSQFVSGLEAEVAPVSVGRQAIQERIRELDFQECKVRVLNVDSQASFENIVIQVIGEISNKSADLKKFVQTFVLAQQPTGYFVLNDIFRYINEEGEEEVEETSAQEEAPSAPLVEDVEMPKAQASAEEPAALDAGAIDLKLEETIESEAPATNGTPVPESVEAEETPVEVAETEEKPATPEIAEKEVEEENLKEPEIPKEPVVTPAITRAPSTTTKPATPVQPAAPAKPMSWASRAAAAVVATPKPAVPVQKTASPAAAATPRAPAPTSTPAAKPAPSTPSAETATPKKDEEAAGWQSVGDNAKRQNRPQSISTPPEKEGTMGYVKYVTEKVGEPELRAALSAFGELIYFDINRGKNCAFVEYKEPAGYQAAFAANPHKVGGEDIYVEPRRPKAGAYGGNGYAGGRGGIAGRGRGGFEQGRGPPSQGRGNFGGQNRGRGGAPRGRGASQATA